MIIKHLENKIRLVGIICTAFLVGCVIISVSSIWTARTMVSDAQKRCTCWTATCPFLSTVPRWMKRLTWKPKAMWRCSTTISSPCRLMTNTSNTRWKRRCIWWTKQVWRNITLLRRKVFIPTSSARVPCSRFIVTAFALTRAPWSSPTTAASESNAEATS